MFKRVAFLYQVVYNERNPFIMKKNIAIICLDKAMARSTAQLLADQLTMRFFDMRELFEFDHKPHSFKDMLGDYGITYYRQKELGILKYASDFENIVFNIDSDVLYKKDTLKNLAENFLIIYMHINPALALKIVITINAYTSIKHSGSKNHHNHPKYEPATSDFNSAFAAYIVYL